MEVILEIKISYMAITHCLLPKTHFDLWQKSCIEIAIYDLLEKINTV